MSRASGHGDHGLKPVAIRKPPLRGCENVNTSLHVMTARV